MDDNSQLALQIFKDAKPVDTKVMTGMPGLETPALRSYVNNNIKTTDKDLRGSRDHHADKTRGYTQEQYDTDPASLYKDQNANFAKDGGQFGRFNNRDYNTTLRLAREVDAYNSMPVDHMFVGTKGGVQDLGTGIDKPKLETMETRAMDQTIKLDSEQKLKGIELQAKINAKDWDAFQNNYKQLFEANMHTMDKEQAYATEARVKQLAQYLDKDKQLFNSMLGLHFSTRKIQMVLDAAKSGDFLKSQMIGTMFGLKSPLPADLLMQATYQTCHDAGLSITETNDVVNVVSRFLGMQNAESATGDITSGKLFEGGYDEAPARDRAEKQVAAYKSARGYDNSDGDYDNYAEYLR